MRKTLIMLILAVICFAQLGQETGLGSFMSLSEAYVSELREDISTLVMTEEMKSMDWNRAKPLLHKYKGDDDWYLIFYVNPDGSYYTLEKGLTDKNLKDRDYFPQLMEGEDFYNFFHISKSTGNKAMMMGSPIYVDNKVVGGLGVSVFLDRLSMRLKKDMALSDDIIFYALAQDGTTALSHNIENDLKDPREVGDPELKEAAEEILGSKEGSTSYNYNGSMREVIFRYSESCDWHFVFGFAN